MCTQLGPSRNIALCSNRSLPYTGLPLTSSICQLGFCTKRFVMVIALTIPPAYVQYSKSMDRSVFWVREPYEIPYMYVSADSSVVAWHHCVRENSPSFETTLYCHGHQSLQEGRLGTELKSQSGLVKSQVYKTVHIRCVIGTQVSKKAD